MGRENLHMYRYFLYSSILLFLASTSITAQTPTFQYSNQTYVSHLKTIVFGPTGYPHLFPLIDLNSGETLSLSFDDTENDIRNYTYKVIHCDRDWQPSGLAPLEYINGFEEENIPTYNFSSRTLQNYINYSLTFPNRNMSPTKSGNYLLVVFEDEDEKRAVITRRFVVVDRQMGVSAEFVRPMEVSKIHTHQEIDFIVNFQRLSVRNAMAEMSASVLQNQRWDNAITGIKPKFLQSDKAIFDFQGEIVFPGGSEFRLIDLRSLRIPHRDIEYMDVNLDNQMEAELLPVINRSKAPHLAFVDFNGRFLIENQDMPLANVQSEYVYTLLSFKVDEPLFDDHVYLFGAITEWQLKPEFQFRYNPATTSYVGRFPLKQGYYNYYLATAPSNADPKQPLVPSIMKTEGSHADTENDYQILVYYRPFGTRYDQLVGYIQANSQQTN